MKNIFSVIFILSLATAAACAGTVKRGADAKPQTQFKGYYMDNNYFSCSIPSNWTLVREKEKDEEYNIYEIQLLAPKSEKVPTSVFVSYYAKDNEDFTDYRNFISRNSKNVLGETKSARENYEPAKKIKLAGRNGFELANEVLEYLDPQTKSDESVQMKEKMYVLPAKDGFYVLKFSAAKDAFTENLPAFEKIAKSFKGKP